MQRAITNDVRLRRNYPDQPPIIPHAIEGYALDLNANKCMSCHARKFTEQSQAPMISVTHFQDRDGNTLGALSPRRYVCLACHVPQTEARPLSRTGSPTWTRSRSGSRDQHGRALMPGPMQRAEQSVRAGESDRLALVRGHPWIRTALSPAGSFSLAFLTLGGFVMGVIFWGGFNTVLEATTPRTSAWAATRCTTTSTRSSRARCTSRIVPGVRAGCPDCHVPHEWTDKIARKMQASKEVWGTSSARSRPATISSPSAPAPGRAANGRA